MSLQSKHYKHFKNLELYHLLLILYWEGKKETNAYYQIKLYIQYSVASAY